MGAMSGRRPVVHVERGALAADPADVSPERLRTLSLRAGWIVPEVLTHVVATARGRRGMAALDGLSRPGVAALAPR
jgi:hypothetical protein